MTYVFGICIHLSVCCESAPPDFMITSDFMWTSLLKQQCWTGAGNSWRENWFLQSTGRKLGGSIAKTLSRRNWWFSTFAVPSDFIIKDAPILSRFKLKMWTKVFRVSLLLMKLKTTNDCILIFFETSSKGYIANLVHLYLSHSRMSHLIELIWVEFEIDIYDIYWSCSFSQQHKPRPLFMFCPYSECHSNNVICWQKLWRIN